MLDRSNDGHVTSNKKIRIEPNKPVMSSWTPDDTEQESAIRALAEQDDAMVNRMLTLPVRYFGLTRGQRILFADAEAGDQSTIPNLTDWLRHGPDPVRALAAQALARFSNRALLIDLFEAGLHDPDQTVRSAALRSLSSLDTGWAIGATLVALSSTKKTIRAQAAEALGLLRHEAAIKPLMSRLQDEEPLAARSAAIALGELRNSDAIPDLVGSLPTHVNAWATTNGIRYTVALEVAHEVLVTLGKIGGDEIVEGLLKVAADPHLDGSWRASAIVGLGHSRDRRAVEVLMPVLHEPSESGLWIRQCAAAEALGRIGDVRAVEALVIALENYRIWGLPADAARALGQTGDASAIGPLCRAFLEGDIPTCEAASVALGKIGGDMAIECLITALAEESHGYDRANVATFGLGVSRDARAVQPLIEVLPRPDYWTRLHAIRALQELADKRAISALIDGLSDTLVDQEAWDFGDDRICDACAKALDHIADPVALDALFHWQETQDPNATRFT